MKWEIKINDWNDETNEKTNCCNFILVRLLYFQNCLNWVVMFTIVEYISWVCNAGCATGCAAGCACGGGHDGDHT